MHIYILYCHPSKKSFTHSVLESFIKGLAKANHTFEINDLYASNFQPDMDLRQYEREGSYNTQIPVPEDIRLEHEKIGRSEVLAFIYPVWWSDCPAKLKGWFDRTWTVGFAYGFEDGKHVVSGINVKKALVICTAGHPNEHLEKTGIAESMRTIMLNDRLNSVGIRQARMEILGGQVCQNEEIRKGNLLRAYKLGECLAAALAGSVEF